MNRTDRLVRPNVRSLIPYSSARDEYEGKEGTFLDANESPFGPLNRYPDPRQRELRSAIGRLKGIAEENIFLETEATRLLIFATVYSVTREVTGH